MKTSWLILLIGAIALTIGFLRARRQRNEHQVLKQEIRKWEDEGGNVPQVPTVSPVVTPETSVPAER